MPSDIQQVLERATARPWQADVKERHDCVVWGPGKKGEFLANVAGAPFTPIADCVAFDVDVANCELIVAAVNSFESNRELIRELAGALRTVTQCSALRESCSQCMKDAYSALAKARKAGVL